MRICFIGDSFVNGTGDPLCQGWSGRVVSLARRNGHDVTHYNLGIRRDTSLDIAARWHGEAARRLPDGVDGRLVFSFGVNDCAIEGGVRRVPPDDTLKAARNMLREASAWKPTLMVGPPPIAGTAVNFDTRIMSESLACLCAGLGVPFLDAFTPLSANPVWMTEVAATDGAHPGAAGYGLLAGLVAAWAPWREWVSLGGHGETV